MSPEARRRRRKRGGARGEMYVANRAKNGLLGSNTFLLCARIELVRSSVTPAAHAHVVQTGLGITSPYAAYVVRIIVASR